MIDIIRPKGQRLFIRAKSKETGKFEYVGYIPKESIWHWVFATSWLLRFGGYSEVRYYNPVTKKLKSKWDINKHIEYCVAHRYNDSVWKDTDYFVKSELLLQKENED